MVVLFITFLIDYSKFASRMNFDGVCDVCGDSDVGNDDGFEDNGNASPSPSMAQLF